MEGTTMGVPIVLWDGFEVVPPPEINDEIIFGSEKTVSNCGESTVTTEEDGTVFSGESSPGAVAEEEWPEEAKSFSFYFVKQRVYDDPEIKAKIDEADQEIYRCNKHRIYVSNAQKSERAEISSLSAQIKSLVPKSQEYRLIFEEKKREFDTLLEALRRLPCSSSDQLCFSQEELDHLIYHAHHQIEHGSLGFEGEDWVVKDIEKPDGIILSEDSLAQKEASINRVKSIAMELHAVKKELDAITWNINHANEKLGKSQNNVRVLDIEMAHILEERDKSYERIKKLRIQRDKGNAAFFQSLTVMRKAKELAACRNVRDLEVFASSEVDGFMTHWNDDKAFRDDYVKRISLSLCERQLDQDGRIKNPEVQAVWEKQVPKPMMAGENVQKTNREDPSSNSSQDGNVITDKQKKDMRKKCMDFNRSSAEESDVIDMEFPVYEKPQKEEEEEVNEETLKERKREEQIEKARLAMERKRKLQEKAAAKAAIRAQKEAEKKLKECAKKAKKKAAANSCSPSEPDQSREVVTELETVKTVTVSGNEKHLKSLYPKQKSFRHKHRRGGTEALPKAILNRRRAHKYWVWGLSSAALACVLILVVLLIRVTGKGKGLALPDQI